MIVVAPATLAPAIAALPTPPQPITATESPRRTPAGVHGRTEPGHDPAAEQAHGGGVGLAVDLRALPRATRVFSMKAPMPSAGVSSVPSVSVIFWVALWVAKQYQGLPLRQARH